MDDDGGDEQEEREEQEEQHERHDEDEHDDDDEHHHQGKAARLVLILSNQTRGNATAVKCLRSHPALGDVKELLEDLYSFVVTELSDRTRHRKLVSRVFSARAVERLRGRTQQIATELLDQIDPRGPVDVVAT